MKIEQEILQEKFEDSYQKAIINLVFTNNWLRDLQSEHFKQYDILPQHFNILRIVRGKHPQAVSPGEIKNVMLDKGNDVTRLLDKLVTKGLIDRRLCEHNRRKMDINITDDGLKLLEAIDIPFQTFFNSLKNRLTKQDAEHLSDLLDKLRG
ncbi:MarR family transcriptional regulator [Solitalea sp. MAHUQ-68]|uniref:MarR family transcriptional regulator n=1 Tax=Solitalea agri TaxID=2953739 RepID=A0A9X2F4K0_9SPHI|nr:MarR family transcriptional regulator [Solitalea agri]MCO4291708.1 MarR family transcriptional regulator [Solitalea agri]